METDGEYQNNYAPIFKMKPAKLSKHFSNGNIQRSPGFGEKYLIRSLRPFNEEKFSLLLLYSALTIILAKIIFAYKDSFVISVFSLDSIKAGFVWLWSVMAPFNWITVPILVGVLVSIAVWKAEEIHRVHTFWTDPDLEILQNLNLTPCRWYHQPSRRGFCCGIAASVVAFLSWHYFLG